MESHARTGEQLTNLAGSRTLDISFRLRLLWKLDTIFRDP